MSVHYGRTVILALCLVVTVFPVGHDSMLMGQSRPKPATVRSNGNVTPSPRQREAPFYDENETVERVSAPRNIATNILSPPDQLGDTLDVTLPEIAVDAGGRADHEKTPLPTSLSLDDSDASTQTASEGENRASRRSGLSSSLLWAVGLLTAGWIAKRILASGTALTSGAPTPIELLSRQTIGPQQHLVLVRLGQRVLLVGTTPSGMSTLATVDDPAEVQSFLDELQPPPASQTGSKVLDVLQLMRPKRDREKSAPPPVRVSTSGWNPPGERAAVPPRAEGVTDV